MARLWFVLIPLLSGCAALKTSAVSGIGAGVGAVVGGPLGAAGGAAIGAGATSLMTTGVSGGQCDTPVTGFWPLMGQVLETGGLLLGAVILVPLIMGYLIPNGFERKRKA